MAIDEHSAVNKRAWEHRAYEFQAKHHGGVNAHARLIMDDPSARLKAHAPYFTNAKDMRVANPCGSNGGRAVALSLLGADVTVFDISEENARYALELASAAGARIEYVVGDVMGVDVDKYAGMFDAVYAEGGILHYFHDLPALMSVFHALTAPGGFLLLDDFHPYRKLQPILFEKDAVGDYFSEKALETPVVTSRYLDNPQAAPLCSLRLYTVAEILNATLGAGYTLRRFDEAPDFTNPKRPGTFTLYAIKER